MGYAYNYCIYLRWFDGVYNAKETWRFEHDNPRKSMVALMIIFAIFLGQSNLEVLLRHMLQMRPHMKW